MMKNNSGITLLALIIIVIVLIIIASISVYEGKELIAKSKVQTLETNMLIIQAKAKSYAEEIDAKIWTDNNKDESRDNKFKNDKKFSDPVTVEQKYLDQISNEIKDNYIAYTITDEALKNMSLEDIKNEVYIVIYNKEDFNKIDIIYADGVKYKGNNYFTLSELKKVLSNDSNN